MRKIITILALGLIAAMCHGQVSNPSIVSVTTAPSGSCANGLPNRQVLSTGAQYSCQSGTWGEIGSGGGGAVSSVSNSDSTLTISPTTGAVVGSINLAHANTWTASQTMPGLSVANGTIAGVTDYIQGTTPGTQPATSVRWNAPASVTSYANTWQSAAPTTGHGGFQCPVGGGACSWNAWTDNGTTLTASEPVQIGATTPLSFKIGGTGVDGQVVYVAPPDLSHPANFSVYGVSANTFYGIATFCSGIAANFVGMAGWYNGMGVCTGVNAGANNNPVFGVNTGDQSLGVFGVGKNMFNVQDNKVVTTYNNTLDDGSGNDTIAGSEKINSTQTSVGCSTSGTANFVMPQRGTTYKLVMVTMAACLGTAAYTFPSVFTVAPTAFGALGSVAASTTTAVTITGTTSTGTITLMAY